jgi:hypothetical protein
MLTEPNHFEISFSQDRRKKTYFIFLMQTKQKTLFNVGKMNYFIFFNE